MRLIRWMTATLALCAAPAFASNYAQCLIDNLAESKSGAVHVAALSMCIAKYPDGFFTIKRGSGRGLLGFKSADACTVDKARNASWHYSATMIRNSCECLYGQPVTDTHMCARYALPPGVIEQHPDANTEAKRIAVEHHYRRIYAAHPDADALFASADFLRWARAAPQRKASLQSGKTDDVISLFSAYKMQIVIQTPTSPAAVNWSDFTPVDTPANR